VITTLSISEAKRRLGEIADRAIQGEQIVIIRKSRLLVLKEMEFPEPVPMRPPGYFRRLLRRGLREGIQYARPAFGARKSAVRQWEIFLYPFEVEKSHPVVIISGMLRLQMS
jgi:hypothetical protein